MIKSKSNVSYKQMIGRAKRGSPDESIELDKVLTEEEKDTLFFDNNGFPDRCSYRCGFFKATRDPFSTGDSPTEYDCNAVKRQECPMWIGDNDE